MPFEVRFCSGGQGGRASFFVDEEATLVVYWEPDRLEIVPPADSAEWPSYRRFLEGLGRAASELAGWGGRENGAVKAPVVARSAREA
ncbi:hypothetical protein SAXI111661_08755 [Saccharomonospora xinjiangensis]|nr:hypothetical protein EYD13_16825 [Saccharomonospora xinjiangensis]